jgi:NAD(P)-dependent dehydrogenase (short-subunit alcohol dehydrogenase family)
LSGLLAGKRALVTGVASGLGAAIARVFAREGARLALVDRDAEGLAAIAGEVGADVRVADLAEAEACAGVVADAITQLGGLDILINNAAILHFAHSREVTPEKWDKTIAVNLSAPFHLSRAAIPHLIEVAELVAFVASPRGSAIHGACLNADGGVTAG